MGFKTLQKFGVFVPSNYFALLFSASRSERPVACTIRRDLVFKMELQLALLFAGIIAFSDSARGKETALAAKALPLVPFPLPRWARAPQTPAVPSEGAHKGVAVSTDSSPARRLSAQGRGLVPTRGASLPACFGAVGLDGAGSLRVC